MNKHTTIDTPARTVVFPTDDAWTLEQMEDAKERLQHIMLALSDDLNSLKTKIAGAVADRHSKNKFADPDWWRRANDNLRRMGTQHQSYQITLGKLSRKINDLRDGSFITVAHDMLPPETFESIKREAQRRAKR